MSLRRIWTALVFLFIGAGMAAVPGAETNNAASALRPFYIIGHGANTLAEAEACLDSGANALEIDVNIQPGRPKALSVDHGPDLETGPAKPGSPRLADFLKGLHALARTHTNFCLLLYDCKTLTTTPAAGQLLLDDSRKYLEGSGDDRVNLNIIISVGKIREKAIFSDIAGKLNPNEGMLVAGEFNPAKVAVYFKSLHVQNEGYSYGVGFFSTCLAHFDTWFAIERACRLRDEDHQIRFVDTWTISNPRMMTKFIEVGVNGIEVDRKFHWYNFSWANLGNAVGSAARIVHDKGVKLGIRLANRGDNPYSIRGASTGR